MTDDQPQPDPIITPDALERWNSLPRDAALQVALTTRDLDNLFLAIRENIIAQSKIGETIIALTNGQTEDAQKAMDAARDHIRSAITHIDSLIVHAMKTAEPV